MLRSVVIAAAATLVSTAPVFAASPHKGATYEGENSKGVKVVLKVSGSGKTANADLYCSKSHVSAIHKLAISHGSFDGVRKSGSTKLWSLKGRFTSGTEAKATASLKAVCAGGNFQLTLDLATG